MNAADSDVVHVEGATKPIVKKKPETFRPPPRYQGRYLYNNTVIEAVSGQSTKLSCPIPSELVGTVSNHDFAPAVICFYFYLMLG